MKINSFRDLVVWNKSMSQAVGVYALVRQFPVDERFGLSMQLRRSAASVPSNIAEGAGFGTNRRYVHHLRIAAGSNSELQTQLELAERLAFATPTQIQPMLAHAVEVGKMLSGLIRSLISPP